MLSNEVISLYKLLTNVCHTSCLLPWRVCLVSAATMCFYRSCYHEHVSCSIYPFVLTLQLPYTVWTHSCIVQSPATCTDDLFVSERFWWRDNSSISGDTKTIVMSCASGDWPVVTTSLLSVSGLTCSQDIPAICIWTELLSGHPCYLYPDWPVVRTSLLSVSGLNCYQDIPVIYIRTDL